MTKNITFILCIFYNKHFFKKVKQNKERSALLDNNPILMGQSKRSLRMNVKIKIVPSVSSSKPSKERDYFYTTETAQSLPDTWVFLPNHHQFPFFSPSRWLLSSCRIGSNCDLRTTPRPMAASQDIQILKNTDVLQELKVSSHASCFLGPLPSASGLQMLYVAPPPASHAWVGPRIGVEQLRKIKVPQQAETITRAASTLAKGGYYLQSPLMGGPGASQTGSGDSLAATLEKMPVSLQINLPVEKALGFPQCLCKQYSVLCWYWKFLGVSSSRP